jgi:hypothetical protein
VARVVKDIERHARKVQSSDEIAEVGTMSANGDRAIGKMIAEAMKSHHTPMPANAGSSRGSATRFDR